MDILQTFTLVDAKNAIMVLLGFVTAISGAIVYTSDKNKVSNIAFFWFAMSVGIWSILLGILEIATDRYLREIFFVILFMASPSIVLTLLFLSMSLSAERIILNSKKILFILTPYIIIIISVLHDGFILKGLPDQGEVVSFGPGYALFSIYLITYLAISFWIITKRYMHSAGVFRTQLRYILSIMTIAISITIFTNLVLPFFGNLNFLWVGHSIASLMTISMGYLVIKYNFLNIKLAVTKFFVSLVILVLVAELLLVKSPLDLIIKIVIIVLVVAASVFLVRSVRNELEAKDEMEDLLKDLAEANEELKVLDKQKSEFVAITAHHLRDPLTAIKGYASLLLEGTFGPLDKKLEGAVKRIFESSKRLVVIIEDFMDISKIESGSMSYTYKTIDLKKMVVDLTDEMRIAAKRAGLKIATEIPEESVLVMVDVGKMRQVLSNLIDNAIKYTPKGELKVKLERNSTSTVLFSISDTGIGMEKKTKRKIFKKFSRAAGVSKLFTDGSGLGLYVAKEIIAEHKGKIWAESEGIGKGSTFFVELSA